VQDAYSLRCAPQVHGASRDLLAGVETTVAIELNAATDNPLVLVEEGMVVSNGNFHGQPLAFGLDTLAMAVPSWRTSPSGASNGSSTRHSRTACRRSSPARAGLNSGFMITQYVAASLVSENKSLCHPASVDSIPTSAGQEDHVSMGNAAGLRR
jgi:histidine ammonia-lyase